MLFMYICILTLLSNAKAGHPERKYTVAAVFYSLALGVKMNILLFAPGMAWIYWRALGLRGAVKCAAVVVGVNV